MIVIVIQNIILDKKQKFCKITLYKRIFAVYFEIISYHYLFSKIYRVIKPLFLYLINRFELYFNVCIVYTVY